MIIYINEKEANFNLQYSLLRKESIIRVWLSISYFSIDIISVKIKSFS